MKTFKKSLLVCDAKMILPNQTGKPLHTEGLFAMQEIWKDISEYEGLYQVSNTGFIRSLIRNINFPQPLKGKLTKQKGYVIVNLYKNTILTTHYVHRIVAVAFIPNPLFKKTVNHINGIKTDNSIENLEWNTHRENNIHAIKMRSLAKI